MSLKCASFFIVYKVAELSGGYHCGTFTVTYEVPTSGDKVNVTREYYCVYTDRDPGSTNLICKGLSLPDTIDSILISIAKRVGEPVLCFQASPLPI